MVVTILTLALGPFTVFYINLRNTNRSWQEYNRLLKSNGNRMSELKNLRNRVREKLQEIVGGWKDQKAGVIR